MASLTPGYQLTSSLRLVRPLGAGGMGRVWIAEHTGLRTQVVVKFISEALASDPEARARFSREAAAASLVKSPHVVHMIDYGVLPTGAFIAMELLEGHDLRQRMEVGGTLPPQHVASLVSQVAKALSRAHERGVVHRDIKPDNIFLSDGGGGEAFIKVLDFGVAKVDDPAQLSHTRTGAALGTPYYMSPEQMLGSKAIDYRSDLWSLGVVALEAMTGKHPFDGETVGALAMAICNKPLPVPSKIDSTLPPNLDAWFARACGRELEDRFASAKELADAFEVAVGGRDAIPYAAATSMRLGHAPTERQSDRGLIEPNPPISPAAASLPVAASSTLGVVSESGPKIQSQRRRAPVVIGAAVGVAAIAGVVAMNASKGQTASAPGVTASGPLITHAASLPGPSQEPDAAQQAPASTPPAVASVSAQPVAAVTAPADAPSSKSATPAPSAKKGIGGTRPPPSASSATADPFGSGRR